MLKLNMNCIESCIVKSRYAVTPHRNLVVDGVPLQSRLDKVVPHRQFSGLVPTLLDCLYDPEERAIVWSRILPGQGICSHAPILMCPDDCDLLRTVIFAEVFRDDQTIWWHRLGIDRSDVPAAVGTTVEWIDGIGPFAFELSAYQRCIESFRGSDAEI